MKSKLLSTYLSLADEGIPVSLNIWTEKGFEGQHFFRLSSSISKRKKSSSNFEHFEERRKEVDSSIDVRPSTPPPVKTCSPDRYLIKPVCSSPPILPETPPQSNSKKTSAPSPHSAKPPDPVQHLKGVSIKNRFSALQSSRESEAEEDSPSESLNQLHCETCNIPLKLEYTAEKLISCKTDYCPRTVKHKKLRDDLKNYHCCECDALRLL